MALLLAAAGLSALFLLWRPVGPASDQVESAVTPAVPPIATPPAVAVAGSPAPGPQTPNLAPEGDADPTADLSSYVARGENPSMGEVIERLHQKGIYTGLGAFSPPGTSPPLVGLAVPEEFALPTGYVRHHQATDDGQRIEAILMFAPDFQLLDANNKPLPMPANRVVPPELAPPGLPIRRIAIPAPSPTPTPGR